MKGVACDKNWLIVFFGLRFTFFSLIQLRKVMIEIGDAFLKDRVIVVSILVLNFNFFAVDVLNFTM